MGDNTGFSRSERAFYQRLANLALSDCSILVEKGRSYGDSWKQRGGIGAFMMLARKWDRIENAVKRNGYDVFTTYDKDSREEGIIDDIRDLRRYLLLVEQHVQRDVFNEMADTLADEADEDEGVDPLFKEPIYFGDVLVDHLKTASEEQQDHAQSIKLEVLQERVVPESILAPGELCTYCLSSKHTISGCESYRKDRLLREHCPE